MVAFRQFAERIYFSSVTLFPTLFVGAVMAGKSRSGEKHGGEDDDGGLGFHVDYPGGGFAGGEMWRISEKLALFFPPPPRQRVQHGATH